MTALLADIFLSFSLIRMGQSKSVETHSSEKLKSAPNSYHHTGSVNRKVAAISTLASKIMNDSDNIGVQIDLKDFKYRS